MANTFTKIASVTVGSGGAATMSFTSIPQTYTDLYLTISGRSAAAVFNSDIFANINGQTTAHNWKIIIGTGTSVASQGSTADNGRVGIMPSATATGNTFSNTAVYYPNYTGSTQKSYSSDSVMENNGTGAYSELVAGINTNTTAISSITVASGNGNFVQYSTATLYGIKSS